MNPIVENGWLVVPYEGEEKTTIELGYTDQAGKFPEKWESAYLDYYNGERVAKITRPPEGKNTYQIYFRVAGSVRKAGKISV